MHEPESQPLNPTQRSTFPWGCLLGGCLTALALMVGGTVLLGLSGYWLYKNQIANYTSDRPRELPTVEIDAEELQALEQRLEQFQEELEEEERTPEQLILTADDINALIAREKNLRGRVFISIEDGQITAEVSIPTDSIPGADGRYFNGSVTLSASLQDGVLIVTAEAAEVNGTNVPDDIMQEIRKQNLAKDVYSDPETAKVLRRFESLTIEDDRLVLTPRKPTDIQIDSTAGNQPTEGPPQATDPTEAKPAESTTSEAGETAPIAGDPVEGDPVEGDSVEDN